MSLGSKIDFSKFETQEVDITPYFSKAELEQLSDYEKKRYENIKRNYDMMIAFGLPAAKPEFMMGPRSRARKRPKSPSSSDETDEDWTPTMNQTKSKAKKMSKFCIPSKGTNILQEEKNLSTDGKKNSRSHEKTKSEISTEVKHQYPLRENRAKNFMALEPPDDDQFLYCEECNKEYEGNCPDHGPLIVVEDSKVPDTCKKDQAQATLPVGLTIKESGIPNAGLGVWADVPFSSRTRFGPYVGVITKDVDKVHATGYAWQIYKDGVASHFVDARDPAQSNWMRYINCARTEPEQNLTAYQYYGHIYYRAFKTIEPGKELLVWYGNEYGRDLGIVRNTKSFLKPKYVNGEEVYCCPWCRTSFSMDVFLAFHVKRIHGCKLKYEEIRMIEILFAAVGNCLGVKLKGQHAENARKKDYLKIPNGLNVFNECASRGLFRQTSKRNLNAKFKQDTVSNLVRFDISIDKCLYMTNVKHQPSAATPYKCDVCGFSCSHAGDLKKHMRTHTGEKPYKCDVCGYSCSEAGHLKKHMRTHTGEKPYKCDVCGYSCSHAGDLKRHMRTHTGEKPYKCDVCGYSCSQAVSLKKHMRTHTGEKPYKCDVCGYSCSQAVSLKTHMRTHTGEKPYKCDVCGYSCSHAVNLKTHMRTHTGEKPYKCDVCGYSCSEAGHLKTHMRTHTGEKPYKCDVCGYSCSHAVNLKTHMRTHTGEKPYKCDVCGYSCSQAVNLKTHMRTHSK